MRINEVVSTTHKTATQGAGAPFSTSCMPKLLTTILCFVLGDMCGEGGGNAHLSVTLALDLNTFNAAAAAAVLLRCSPAPLASQAQKGPSHPRPATRQTSAPEAPSHLTRCPQALRSVPAYRVRLMFPSACCLLLWLGERPLVSVAAELCVCALCAVRLYVGVLEVQGHAGPLTCIGLK